MNVIDFTMMCVFYFYSFFYFSVCVHDYSSRNNASIFNFSILFDGKANLVGTFGRSKFKIPKSFQKRQVKQHQIEKKQEFFGVTLKQMNIGT